MAGAPILNVRAKRGSDGTLWFVRGGGLTSVLPQALAGSRDHDTKVPVLIEGALADEARLEPIAGTALSPGTRRVQINYTALTLRAPNRMRFRYRLDGFDPDWVDAGSRRQAFYTNLPPRQYTFHVEATTDQNVWNGASAAWDFRIRPMFYQTRWFYRDCRTLHRARRRRRLAGPGAADPPPVFSRPGRTDPVEPGNPRHAAAKHDRRGAAIRCVGRESGLSCLPRLGIR